MRPATFIAFVISLAAAVPVNAQDPRLKGGWMTQLEAGLNAYDLNQRNLWPDDHPDMAMACAASTAKMSFALLEAEATETSEASAKNLKAIARIWLAESAKRRGIELEVSNEEFFTPAYSLMSDLDFDTLSFWTEHCLDLTRELIGSQTATAP